MKILAVDDDPSILEVMEAALSSLDNYTVVTAMSAPEGLEILDEDPDPFDAMLIDIQMPEMNGIEMCREVRRLPEYSDTPVIVVTAMSQRSYVSDAFRAGATDYVTKPFDLIDLRSRVASALRQSRRMFSQNTSVQRRLDEPLQLRNVTRFLGREEYENYVMQISQSLTSKSSVVAIKIRDVETLHDELEWSEFEELIETVGGAISVLTRQEGHLISYQGNGVFLCIRIGRFDVLPEAFETILNRQIFVSRPPSMSTYVPQVCVGETTTLKSASKTGAIDALKRAVDSAEARAESSEQQPEMSRRVLSNQSRSNAERQVDRRAYSVLLRQVMKEDAAGHTAPEQSRKTAPY